MYSVYKRTNVALAEPKERKRLGAHGGSLFGLRWPCLRHCIWRRSEGL